MVQLSGLVLCSQAAEVDGRCTAAGTPALFGTRVIVLFDLAETWTLYLAVAVAGAWWVVATWALSLAIAGRAWALEMFWWLRYVAYLLSGLFFVPVTTSLLAWLDSGSRTPQEGTTGKLGTVLMWSIAVGVLALLVARGVLGRLMAMPFTLIYLTRADTVAIVMLIGYVASVTFVAPFLRMDIADAKPQPLALVADVAAKFATGKRTC